MENNGQRAKLTGALFLIAAMTAMIGLFLYDPILHNSKYIIGNGNSNHRVVWGMVMEIMTAFAVVGTSITLYPILRKYSESMALGAICFRTLEAFMILLGILCLLTLISLKQEYIIEKELHPNFYLVVHKLLVSFQKWTFLFGPNLLLGPSTFFTSYLLLKGNLVSRLIALLGLMAGPLITLFAILVMFGIFHQVSISGLLFALPVFLYEMSLALWLIFKGFNSNGGLKHMKFQKISN